MVDIFAVPVNKFNYQRRMSEYRIVRGKGCWEIRHQFKVIAQGSMRAILEVAKLSGIKLER